MSNHFNSFVLCSVSSNNCESDSEDFISTFSKVFSSSSNNNYQDNIEEEDKSRFYNKENSNTNTSTGSVSNVNLIPIIFNVSKEESVDLIGKKRGRKTPENENDNKDNNNINNGKKKHGKFDIDNILTKIQVYYINFIVNFINEILDFFEHDKNERFKLIDYKLKQKVNQKNFVALKSKKLSDILCMGISPKNKKIECNYNQNLYY